MLLESERRVAVVSLRPFSSVIKMNPYSSDIHKSLIYNHGDSKSN